MKHKLFIAGAITTAFGIGFVSGEKSMKKEIIKRLKASGPLLATITTDLIDESLNGHMSKEELKAYAKEQMDFVKIVS